MRKLLYGLSAIALVSGGIIGSSLMAKAGIWEKLTSMNNVTVEAKVFNIEASGWNLRGYLFKIPGNNKICLFVAGSEKGGLSCWTEKK